MALDNPQLVHFCNENARVFADILAKAHSFGLTSLSIYNARDLGTIINDGGAQNFIEDGSDIDGRTRVTGGDVFNLVTVMQDFLAFIEASGRKDIVAKWRVNF